jgi:flagellar hook-length control protein FliK
MNPFNSSAVSKAETVSVSAPSDGVEVVAEDGSFSGMLADVLVDALSDPSGEENENASDNRKNNPTGEPVQNPEVISMPLPEMALVCPPVIDADLDTWCASVTLSDCAGTQSLTWMRGEETIKAAMSDEASKNLSGNQLSVDTNGSPVAAAPAAGNNPLLMVPLPSAPQTDASESLFPAPSDTAVPLTEDVSTTASSSASVRMSLPDEPGKGMVTVPADKAKTVSPAATGVFEQTVASDDPKTFASAASIEESEDTPVAGGTDADSSVSVGVSLAGLEDDQAAPAGQGSAVRKKTKAVQRADMGTSARRSSPGQSSSGYADAAGRGTKGGQDETGSPSSQSGGGESGSPRGENILTLSGEMNSRTMDERIPATLQPGATAQVLNGIKTTDNSALPSMDGGASSRAMSSHILSRVEQFQEFVSNLDHHILAASASREKTMTVTLVPESLGKVVLNCREQGGQLWVEIQAANQSVREVLQRQENAIRQLMDQSGCQLMQFDVRSQTGEGDVGRFRRQSQESEDAADGEGHVQSIGQGSEAPVATNPTLHRRGLWVVA